MLKISCCENRFDLPLVIFCLIVYFVGKYFKIKIFLNCRYVPTPFCAIHVVCCQEASFSFSSHFLGHR